MCKILVWMLWCVVVGGPCKHVTRSWRSQPAGPTISNKARVDHTISRIFPITDFNITHTNSSEFNMEVSPNSIYYTICEQELTIKFVSQGPPSNQRQRLCPHRGRPHLSALNRRNETRRRQIPRIEQKHLDALLWRSGRHCTIRGVHSEEYSVVWYQEWGAVEYQCGGEFHEEGVGYEFEESGGCFNFWGY